MSTNKLKSMTKAELIDEALLKHVSGGNTCGEYQDTCGSDAGTNCYHDTCYQWVDTCGTMLK